MKEYFDEATKNLPACSSILAGVRVWIYVGIYTYKWPYPVYCLPKLSHSSSSFSIL